MWSIFFNLGINLQNVLNLEEDIQNDTLFRERDGGAAHRYLEKKIIK